MNTLSLNNIGVNGNDQKITLHQMKISSPFTASSLLHAAFGFGLLLLLTGCFGKDKGNSATAAPPVSSAPPAVPVDGMVLLPATLAEELEVTGSLVANQQVDIVSELTRKLVRVDVKEGSYVKTGDLLFQLD